MNVILTNGNMLNEINQISCSIIMEKQNRAHHAEDYTTIWSANYGDDGPKFVKPFRIIRCGPTHLDWASIGIDAGPFSKAEFSTHPIQLLSKF